MSPLSAPSIVAVAVKCSTTDSATRTHSWNSGPAGMGSAAASAVANHTQADTHKPPTVVTLVSGVAPSESIVQLERDDWVATATNNVFLKTAEPH